MEPAPPYDEEPCFLPAGGQTLFGILTRPRPRPPTRLETRGTTVTMLTGGGYVTSIHRNRLSVRLARRLAARGHHGFRFDYHGTGESWGTIEHFSLEEPLVDDLDGALGWLEAQGLRRHLLVGSALGARTALAVAAARPEGMAGLVLVTPALGDVDRNVVWRDRPGGEMQVVAEESGPGQPVSPRFLEPLRRLVARRVPVLVVYGADQPALRQFQGGELADLARSAGGSVQVRGLPGRVPQLLDLGVQEALVDLVVDWVEHR